MTSIHTKIMALIMSCVLLAAITIGGTGIFNAKRVVEEDAEEIMRLLAEEKANEIDVVLYSIEQSVTTIYNYAYAQLNVQDFKRYPVYVEAYSEKIESVVQNVAENTDGSIAVYVRFNPELTTPTSGLLMRREDGSSYFKEEILTDLSKYSSVDTGRVGWYYMPIQQDEACWIGPYKNENFDMMISYVIPFVKDDALIGVVGMDIDLALLRKGLSNVCIYKTGDAFLFDAVGNLIYHKNYQAGLEKNAFIPEMEQLWQQTVKANVLEHTLQYRNREGKHALFAKKLRNGMILGLNAPMKEIYAPRDKVIIEMLVCLLIILIISISFTVHLTRCMTRPIKALTEIAKCVSEGDLTVVIDVDTKDEIGILANTFKETVAHLKEHVDYAESLAYTDSATGISSKVAYKNAIDRIEEQILRGTAHFAVIVMDINNLKQVNDTLGHEFGDKFILDAVNAMKIVFKEKPIYRIGGDEFVVFLEQEELRIYRSYLAGFDQALKNFNENHLEYGVPLQVARGIAIYTEEKDKSFVDVFRRADRMMYRNKMFQKSSVS